VRVRTPDRKIVSVVIVGALALVAAGCGSGDTHTGANAGSPTTVASGPQSTDTTASGAAPTGPSTAPTTVSPTTAAPTTAVPTTVASTTTTTVSLAGVTSALTAAVQGLQVTAPMGVPAGYEAASWDQQGDVYFWEWTSRASGWARVGSSTYPVLNMPSGDGSTNITGQTLPGMDDATFIANGQYSGDGTGSYIAFTNGSNGWGTIAPGPSDTLIPSGDRSTDNSTPGEQYAMGFAGNLLETATIGELPFGPNGEQFPLDQYWHWQAGSFVVDHDNVLTAAAAPAPPTSAGPIPLGTCPSTPPDGTYSGYWTAEDTAGTTLLDGGPQQVTISVSQNIPDEGPGVGVCSFVIGAYTPVEIPVTTSSGGSWITAPAWILDEGADGQEVWGQISGSPLSQWSGAFTTPDASPYDIPADLGVIGFESAPDSCVVTIAGGVLTSFFATTG
jgi:uncharacterized protein YceK